MDLKETLTKQLLDLGARPGSFSINDPKNFCLNFQQIPGGYAVWFQEDGTRFEEKTYPNLGEAVYEFAARLLHKDAANILAEKYHDPDLVLYSN